MSGEPADMQLVDDSLCKGPSWRCVTLPIVVARVDHYAPERGGGVVARIASRLPAATRRPGNAFPVRVEQHLVVVETQPPSGIERSGHTVAVKLACGDAGHKDVPIVVGAI